MRVAQNPGDDVCRPGLLLIDSFRAEFYECCAPGMRASSESGVPFILTPECLAVHWMKLVQDQCGHMQLDAAEKDLIALRVAQRMREMDLLQRGHVRLEEWVHYMLNARTGFVGEQVNALISEALRRNARALTDLQDILERGSMARDAALNLQEGSGARCTSPPRREPSPTAAPEPAAERLPSPPRAPASEPSPAGEPCAERRAHSASQSVCVGADERATYPAFVARCLRRAVHEVKLHLYDISSGLAEAASPYVVGHRLEGLWHTGTVVFGNEYYFSRDIMLDIPGQTAFGAPTKVIHLGYTAWRQDEVHAYIITVLKPRYHRDTYDIVTCNCNHLTDQFAMHLVGRHVPDEVMQQPKALLQSRIVQVARPVLNWYIRDRVKAREFDAELPPAWPRVSPSDGVDVGTIVCIHPPAVGESDVILGRVAHPPSVDPLCKKAGGVQQGRARRASAPAICCSASVPAICCRETRANEGDHVCVQFFDDAPLLIGTAQNRLRIEFVPRGRLSVVKIADVASVPAYNLAVAALCERDPVLAFPHDLQQQHWQQGWQPEQPLQPLLEPWGRKAADLHAEFGPLPTRPSQQPRLLGRSCRNQWECAAATI